LSPPQSPTFGDHDTPLAVAITGSEDRSWRIVVINIQTGAEIHMLDNTNPTLAEELTASRWSPIILFFENGQITST